MAKCVVCGKKGLLLKVDRNGMCPECAEKAVQERMEQRARELQAEQDKAKARLDSIPLFNLTYSTEKRNRQRNYDEVKTSNITPKGVIDDYVVLDLETTGLAPSRDRIVEICAIKYVDNEPVSLFHTFINPERPMPVEASSVNGITDEMLKDAPKINEVLPSLEEFIGDFALVGHNLDFDLKFLFYSGSVLLDTKRKYYDTFEQAKRILKMPRMVYDKEYETWERDYDSDYDVEDYKLDTLCSYYRIKRYSEHRADADALATGDLFINLIEEKQG